MTGSGGISGTGNSAAANLITGNGGGNNKLSGMDANDTLDGATGADTLSGPGKGNDTYLTDGGDTITEAASEGTDLVKGRVSHTLGAEPLKT